MVPSIYLMLRVAGRRSVARTKNKWRVGCREMLPVQPAEDVQGRRQCVHKHNNIPPLFPKSRQNRDVGCVLLSNPAPSGAG